MDSSTFARLPPELRSQIFTLALRYKPGPVDLADISNYNQLTTTCRQIRHETDSILYTLNSFTLSIKRAHKDRLCTFLKRLGAETVSQLPNLHFRVTAMNPPRPGMP